MGTEEITPYIHVLLLIFINEDGFCHSPSVPSGRFSNLYTAVDTPARGRVGKRIIIVP
jgi:hypothetical protein